MRGTRSTKKTRKVKTEKWADDFLLFTSKEMFSALMYDIDLNTYSFTCSMTTGLITKRLEDVV